ncbi:DoxX family protein [Enterobacter wuhouensis]|uniref:DoxX family protein n=1 Tax=Enterobacter wuhouensis TaxID=2529381 RepID=UPI002FCF3306
MVKAPLNSVNKMLMHEDFGRLLLRLTIGGLMMFHGLHKLFGGIDGIAGMLIEKGLPGFIAYGVLIGEVVCPILIILGILTRPSALVLAFTMAVAWLMVDVSATVELDKTGAWAIESVVYYFVGGIALAFLGAGRYSVVSADWR